MSEALPRDYEADKPSPKDDLSKLKKDVDSQRVLDDIASLDMSEFLNDDAKKSADTSTKEGPGQGPEIRQFMPEEPKQRGKNRVLFGKGQKFGEDQAVSDADNSPVAENYDTYGRKRHDVPRTPEEQAQVKKDAEENMQVLMEKGMRALRDNPFSGYATIDDQIAAEKEVADAKRGNKKEYILKGYGINDEMERNKEARKNADYRKTGPSDAAPTSDQPTEVASKGDIDIVDAKDADVLTGLNDGGKLDNDKEVKVASAEKPSKPALTPEQRARIRARRQNQRNKSDKEFIASAAQNQAKEQGLNYTPAEPELYTPYDVTETNFSDQDSRVVNASVEESPKNQVDKGRMDELKKALSNSSRYPYKVLENLARLSDDALVREAATNELKNRDQQELKTRKKMRERNS